MSASNTTFNKYFRYITFVGFIDWGTGVPCENNQHVASHWKIWSHQFVSSTHHNRWESKLPTWPLIGTHYIDRCKFNNHMTAATMLSLLLSYHTIVAMMMSPVLSYHTIVAMIMSHLLSYYAIVAMMMSHLLSYYTIVAMMMSPLLSYKSIQHYIPYLWIRLEVSSSFPDSSRTSL